MDVAKKLTPQEFRTMQLLELDSLHLISDEIWSGDFWGVFWLQFKKFDI